MLCSAVHAAIERQIRRALGRAADSLSLWRSCYAFIEQCMMLRRSAGMQAWNLWNAAMPWSVRHAPGRIRYTTDYGPRRSRYPVD
eukprot:760331-Rhodomonas_salina.3